MKGVLRDHFRHASWARMAFGSLVGDTDPAAGALAVTDAHVVLFPVRSLFGTFAYATSPLALRRVGQDLRTLGMDLPADLPDVPASDTADVRITSRSVLIALREPAGPRSNTKGPTAALPMLYLEDYDFPAKSDSAVDGWAKFLGCQLFPDEQDPLDVQGRESLAARLVVLPDAVFDMVCEHHTDVQARIRVDPKTGTVQSGALWYEEVVPQEAVFGGFLWCDRLLARQGDQESVDSPASLLASVCERPLRVQVGGDAGIGRGWVQVTFGGVR